MADSFKLILKEGRKIKYPYKEDMEIYENYNTTCFSEFNTYIINNKNNIDEAYIVIEEDKINTNGIDFSNKYLELIKNLEIIPFEIIKENNNYLLKLELDKIKNKSHLQYTGMIVRCLYEPSKDRFQEIAKYFVELCDYFPELDKCKLFTISCNLFLVNLDQYKSHGWTGRRDYSNEYNPNHILMYERGCKILDEKEIINIIDKNTGINSNFSMERELKNPEIYKLDSRNKQDYEKIINSEFINPVFIIIIIIVSKISFNRISSC